MSNRGQPPNNGGSDPSRTPVSRTGSDPALWWLSPILKVAAVIGRVQTWLILTVFYFVIAAPVALLYQLLADPLHLRRRSSMIWASRMPPRDLKMWVTSQS